MGGDVEIQVVAERRIDPLGVFAPTPRAFEEENVIFEARIERCATLGKDLNVKSSTHEMSVVVDMNVLGQLPIFEPVVVDAFLVILADVVPDNHSPVPPLHDSQKPIVVVAVVVLNERVYTVIVGVEPAAVFAARPHVPVGLIVLYLYSTCSKTIDAMTRAISAAVGEDIVFIYGVFADSRNDVVASRAVHDVAGHVYISP